MDPLSDYTKERLIAALQNEYVYLIHDDFNPEEDMMQRSILNLSSL